MQTDMATGFGQADLSLRYDLHEGGFRGFSVFSIKLKDLQVALAEFIGTFFLALIIGCSKIITAGSAALGIGFGLTALVYLTGPISGGQLNPAVTIGLLVRSKISLFEAVYCIFFQIWGVMFAGLISYGLYYDQWNNLGAPSVHNSDRRIQSFFGELIQTFGLVSVVLNTATTKAQANNSYFGLAIGFVVFSGAVVIGGVSGACFNPAIALLSLMKGDFDDLWVFLCGPTLGGVLAGLVFRITNPSEWEESDPIARLTKSHHNPSGNLTRMAAMLTQEFIGTFFIAWTIALSVNATSSTNATIAIGAIVVSMVYSGGSISGGHYNPCVTLGVYLRGRLETPHMMRPLDVFLYFTVQFLSSFLAGAFAIYVQGGSNYIGSPLLNLDSHSLFSIVVVEFIFSTMLVLTVLSTATTEKVGGNSYFGIAIGFAITAGIVTVNDISGGVFNPAIGVALPALTGNDSEDLWVYVVGDFLGAAAAAGIYYFWHLDEGSFGLERRTGDLKGGTQTASSERKPQNDLHNALLDGVIVQ